MHIIYDERRDGHVEGRGEEIEVKPSARARFAKTDDYIACNTEKNKPTT